MTQDVTYCRPDDLLQDIWLIMKERSLLHIPIVGQDFKPLGAINARDALFELLGEVEHDESLLRDYVMGIGDIADRSGGRRPQRPAHTHA
jgi:CBS domain-containing protein